MYYSAFSPIPDSSSALPPRAAPLVREHRLYQADWLLRFYGFTDDELATGDDGNMPLEMDPKLAWALAHRETFPVDVNRAPRELLLRVPGLGQDTVRKILLARRHRAIRREDLHTLHVARRADPFLLAAGDVRSAVNELDRLHLKKKLTEPAQLALFAARDSAVRGEL